MAAPSQAKPATSLTPEQRALLSRVGECWGAEPIMPNSEYGLIKLQACYRWADELGICPSDLSFWFRSLRGQGQTLDQAIDTVSNAMVIAFDAAAKAFVDAMAKSLIATVLGRSPDSHAPTFAHSGAKDHANPATGVAQE